MLWGKCSGFRILRSNFFLQTFMYLWILWIHLNWKTFLVWIVTGKDWIGNNFLVWIGTGKVWTGKVWTGKFFLYGPWSATVCVSRDPWLNYKIVTYTISYIIVNRLSKPFFQTANYRKIKFYTIITVHTKYNVKGKQSWNISHTSSGNIRYNVVNTLRR